MLILTNRENKQPISQPFCPFPNPSPSPLFLLPFLSLHFPLNNFPHCIPHPLNPSPHHHYYNNYHPSSSMVQAKPTSATPGKFNSFWQFYPFYLSQHSNIMNRRFHCIATTLFVITILYCILSTSGSGYRWLLPPLCGYGFAWIGHFFFELNKPATFKYPVYSLMGDFVMMSDIIRGRIKI